MWLNVHFRPDKTGKLNTILEHHKGHMWVSLGPDPDALTSRDVVGLMYFLLCKGVVNGALQIDLLPTKYVDVQSKAFYFYTMAHQQNQKKQNHRLHIYNNNNNKINTLNVNLIQENEIIMSILSEIKSVIDMPPNVMYPQTIMDFVVKFARRHKVQVLERMDRAELVARGLQGVVQVGRGSTPAHQPHLAVLGLNYYRRGRGNNKPIVLVGKGITYDSGGYSLKTAAQMKNMKQDKTGALIVLGVMGVLARLKVSCPVVAILPFAENVVSADSYKPDEIIKSHKGLSVEVSNTDAEGRLLLMDALSLAVQEYEPRAIVDVATLTGVGVFCGKYGAIHGNHLDFEWLLQRIGQKHGDAFWVMPPSDAFVAATQDTPVANVKNDDYTICPMAAAATTVMAAAFLANFVPAHIPWAHLDLGDSKSLYECFDDKNSAKTNSFLTLIYFLKAGFFKKA